MTIVNNAVFRKGGVLGRTHYVINQLVLGIIGLSLYSLLSFFLGDSLEELFSIPISIGILYFNIMNGFKRLRDIRQREITAIEMGVLVLLSLIPFVNLGLFLYLSLKAPEEPLQDGIQAFS